MTRAPDDQEELRRNALTAFLDERVREGYQVETRTDTHAIIAPADRRRSFLDLLRKPRCPHVRSSRSIATASCPCAQPNRCVPEGCIRSVANSVPVRPEKSRSRLARDGYRSIDADADREPGGESPEASPGEPRTAAVDRIDVVTIAELVGRIETLELANQEVADGVGSLRRREQRRNEQTQGGRSAPPLSSPRPPTRARR